MAVDPERVRRLGLFAGLDAAELTLVADAAEERSAAAGAAVASETDFGHALFGLEDGCVDILRDGKPIRRLETGEVFGEIALLRSGRRTATAVAVTDCRLLTWFKADVWRLESRAPGFTRALQESANARLAAESEQRPVT